MLPTWVYAHEAVRCGATLNPPCVNRSRIETSINGKDIYLGFVHLQNLENRIAAAIVRARGDGEFRDMRDFVSRVRPGLEQLLLLIRCGAFRFTGKKKPDLLWEAQLMLNRQKSEPSGTLFDPTPKPIPSRTEEGFDRGCL
ncbi:MAG: hypothetical protein R2727_12230 [Bacteroidales bacterium]